MGVTNMAYYKWRREKNKLSEDNKSEDGDGEN